MRRPLEVRKIRIHAKILDSGKWRKIGSREEFDPLDSAILMVLDRLYQKAFAFVVTGAIWALRAQRPGTHHATVCTTGAVAAATTVAVLACSDAMMASTAATTSPIAASTLAGDGFSAALSTAAMAGP